jgi:hypothetical protein
MWTLQTKNPTFLVEPDIRTLTKSRKKFPVEWETVALGKDLSDFLVSQEATDHTQTIYKWLEDYLQGKMPGPIICSDIDILFHPSLKLDPLSIFRQIGRYVSIVVLWPGTYRDGVLSYARPEHQHYRFWKNLDGIEFIGANDEIQ